MKTKCPKCSKIFQKTHNRQKYCDKNCSLEARKQYNIDYEKNRRKNKVLRLHICQICNIEYLTNKSLQKFCSKKCFNVARKKRHRINSMKLHRKQRNNLMYILGQKCVVCGIDDKRMLVFDHIYGGGTQERKKMGQASMVRYYLRNPLEAKRTLQILCSNHNRLKEWTKNEE